MDCQLQISVELVWGHLVWLIVKKGLLSVPITSTGKLFNQSKKKWKKPRPRQESLRECLARAAEELELSASTVLDIPELECSPREVLLERHHGVLEYTDERIRVAARDVTVEIRGMDLRLGAMSQGALHIRGQVAAVEFIRS